MLVHGARGVNDQFGFTPLFVLMEQVPSRALSIVMLVLREIGVQAHALIKLRTALLVVLVDIQHVDALLHHLEVAEEDHVDDARAEHRNAETC